MIKMDIPLIAKGSFKIRVYNKDGSLREELPEQENLITDTGLFAMFGRNNGTSKWGDIIDDKLKSGYFTEARLNETTNDLSETPSIFLGEGSGVPSYTDKLLFRTVGYNNWNYNYNLGTGLEDANDDHPNHVMTWTKQRFQFNVFNGSYNLTELGLGKFYTSASTFADFETHFRNAINNNGMLADNQYKSTYTLLTHSMIKDENGNEYTISITVGELLDIEYTIRLYFPINPFFSEFKLITKDNKGNFTEEDFECVSIIGKGIFIHQSGLPLITTPSDYDSYHRYYSNAIYIYSEEALEGFDFTKVTLNDWIKDCRNFMCNNNTTGAFNCTSGSDYFSRIRITNYKNIVNTLVDDEYKLTNYPNNLPETKVSTNFTENNITNKGEYEGLEKVFNVNTWLTDSYQEKRYSYNFPDENNAGWTNGTIPNEYFKYRLIRPGTINGLVSKQTQIWHPESFNPIGWTNGSRIRAIFWNNYLYRSSSGWNSQYLHFMHIFRSKTTGRGIPKNNNYSILIQRTMTASRYTGSLK